uniref:Putative acyl-coa synthetase n=1 Tax=Amblyomma aureolatum TaxID=187763 RepID=A0A1E1XE52_9ACAR
MKARIEDGIVYSPYPSIDIPVCSFYDLAREKLLTNPDKTALFDDVTSLTRAEVLAHMQRYAVGFRQNGVLPGDRVCVHLKNSVENLIAMYGCVLAGATIILAKTSLTEGELRYQAQDSDSTHILTDEQYTEKAWKAVADLAMKGLFCMGDVDSFISASTFSALDERDFEESPVNDPQNTVLAVCYTSGTTGLPKGAEVTHYNYVGCFYTCRPHVPWGETDVMLGMCPITHQSGMLYSMTAVLDGGSCVVTPIMMGPLEIMDAVDKYKVTAALLFPSQLQGMVREMQRTGRRLPSLRGIGIGGSVLATSVAEAAREAFVGIENLVNAYGMTESCGVVTGQPKTGKPHTGADVGVPATMVEVKVVDVATGRKLGAHQTGEICYRSVSAIKSYYKRPKDTAELYDKEGWLKSGDAGYYDEDGRFYIVDRLKQMIKCMDNQVVPAELEELLLREHGAEIAEVSVVGIPHQELGEAPAAAIVLTEEGSRRDRQQLAESIKGTVERSLAVHKQLYGGVFFVDSLPKTETGKINRSVLARSLFRA